MQNYNPRILEDEIGRSQDQGQPQLHNKTLSGTGGGGVGGLCALNIRVSKCPDKSAGLDHLFSNKGPVEI